MKIGKYIIALSVTGGMSIGFGFISIMMTLGYFFKHDVIIDYRFWIYCGLFIFSLLSSIILYKNTHESDKNTTKEDVK